MATKMQILDAGKFPVCLNEIDKIACKHWGQKYRKEYYCSPFYKPYVWDDNKSELHNSVLQSLNESKYIGSDWYNMIGQPISMLSYGEHTWDEVKAQMIKGLEDDCSFVKYMQEVYYPLIDEFEQLGLIPFAL